MITIQMVLYSLVKLLQQGIVAEVPEIQKLLAQNKYYFIPVVNVDGLALLEETHKGDPETHTMLVQRKNLDGYSECEEDPKNGN